MMLMFSIIHCQAKAQGRDPREEHGKNERLQFPSLCVAASPWVALTKQYSCKRFVGF